MGRLAIENGAARFIDRTVSPAYAEELSTLNVQATGLTTGTAKSARVDARAMLGHTGVVAVRGAVRALGGPLFIDLDAELRDFPVSRVNPYMRRYVSWTARDGRLTTSGHYRIDGPSFSAWVSAACDDDWRW